MFVIVEVIHQFVLFFTDIFGGSTGCVFNNFELFYLPLGRGDVSTELLQLHIFLYCTPA